jgi:hypothetical protein
MNDVHKLALLPAVAFAGGGFRPHLAHLCLYVLRIQYILGKQNPIVG